MRVSVKLVLTIVFTMLLIIETTGCSAITKKINSIPESNNISENSITKIAPKYGKIPFMPVSYDNIKQIKLWAIRYKDQTKIDRSATEEETKQIISYLNDIKKYDNRIENKGQHQIQPQSIIEILAKDNNEIYLTNLGKDTIGISFKNYLDYSYIVKNAKLYLILEKLRE